MTRSPSAVVVGVIDDGIAFAHERFRNSAAESRIEFLWFQSGGSPAIGSPLAFGRELTKADIDGLLAGCIRGGILDEDLVYARSGQLDFREPGHKSVGRRASHGSHVLDLASGFDPTPGRNAPIVCVQLPAAVTADTSGGNLAPAVLSAVHYILDRAGRIGDGRRPVVINLSYGFIAGPHDGTSDLELALDDIVQQRRAAGLPVEVILPAGNNHLSRCHAQVAFARTGEVARLRWRVHPDDLTPSYVEIWMPFRAGGTGAERLQVTITSPTGVSRSLRDTHGQFRAWAGPGGTYAEILYSHSPAPTNRGRFLVSLNPTATLDAGPMAPAGTWTFDLANLGLSPNDTVHAWVQRDDSLYGHPRRGRQSYFDDPDYRRHDHAGREITTDDGASLVRRAGTLNAIATGRSPSVAGGYSRLELSPAAYSASGPIVPAGGQAPPHRTGPDVLVPSDDSVTHGGVLAAGSRSGSVVAMGGTSAAAPQLARWAAEELAHHRPADRATAAGAAQADETTLPAAPPVTPERGGSGRLRLGPVHDRRTGR